MSGQRYLYYTPWCMSDAASIACGLSYNGEDKETKEPKFDRIVNIYVYNVECGTSPNMMMSVSSSFSHIFFRTGTIKSTCG
jgi:hypothetical protein